MVPSKSSNGGKDKEIIYINIYIKNFLFRLHRSTQLCLFLDHLSVTKGRNKHRLLTENTIQEPYQTIRGTEYMNKHETRFIQ